MDETSDSKKDQLKLALNYPFITSHSLDKIRLIPELLPDINFEEVDTSITIFNHTLSAPILIAPLTGGTPEAESINMTLARVAHVTGIGMSVGSQKAMLENPNLLYTYQVRKVAPGILLFSNIGAVDTKDYSNEEIESLITNIQADGIMLHLNPMQEVFQKNGKTNFAGVIDRIRELISSISYPVIVRSIGCGMDAVTAKRLVQTGVHGIDIAGNDGINWIIIEGERSNGEKLAIAESFNEWGLSLRESLLRVKEISSRTLLIATGGITTGLQGAKALVLGAQLFSIGRIALHTLITEGEKSLIKLIEKIKLELKITMFGVGASTVKELHKVSYIIDE